MHAPAGYDEREEQGIFGVVRADLRGIALASFLDAGQKLPAARGRGDGVCVVHLRDDVRGVVRRFRRGGALAGVLGDQFLDRDRAARELWALVSLRARGVPVVEPLAALAQRDGGRWRLHLVTALVPRALPLPAFVARHPDLRRAAVARAGAVVARAFDAGLRHRDLHPDNLIAVPGPDDAPPLLHMLDLDRARVGAPAARATRLAMLTRMARYLVRHRDTLPVTASRADALRFLRGMGLGRGDRHEWARAIGARLRRQLALRRWFGR